MKLAEDVVAVGTNNSQTILSNEVLEHLPLDVCLELEVRASSFGSAGGNNNSMELPTTHVPSEEDIEDTAVATPEPETNMENGFAEPGETRLEENESSNIRIEAMEVSQVEKTNEPQISEVVAPQEARMDVAPVENSSSADDKLLKVQVPQLSESRKRSLDEDFEPALMRIPSQVPSPSADFIRIYKDEFKIGRKPDNDEIILSVLISRNHCILKKDPSRGEWFLTNLSSTDTLLNDKHIERNQNVPIKEGDILQLSLADTFKYKFTYVNKDHGNVKHPKLEPNNDAMDSVLDRQMSFVQLHENERKVLDDLVVAKQQEQEELRKELDKLLQEQKATKSCNEELNNQIAELQKKIEIGNATEIELTEKYRDLLSKLEEERFKFEEKLAEEKQRFQEALREKNREKEQLEMTLVEQMEEWRVKLEKKQQEDYQRKIDGLLSVEKNLQAQLQHEKQILQQKLKEKDEALKQKEIEQQKERVKAQQQALAVARMRDQKPCIVVLQPLNNGQQPVPGQNLKVQSVPGKNLQIQPVKNPQQYSIVDTIDLTNENGGASTSSKSEKGNAVVEKVNNIMDEQLTCSICSELFIQPMLLTCSHLFCNYCILQWKKRGQGCPQCRLPITTMSYALMLHNFIEKMVETLTPEQMARRKVLIAERNGKVQPVRPGVQVIKKVVQRRR